MADGPTPGRRVDEALLRHLREIFGRMEPVGTVSLFPANRQESLVVEFDTAYYPEAVKTVRLETRVYTNGEFHITYVETYLGERRYCRWDRHDQPHNSRDHSHPLPAASAKQAADREFPVDVVAVLRTVVLPWVDDRLGELWARESSE